jgi:cell wall-associated NlpC family hydrolase
MSAISVMSGAGQRLTDVRGVRRSGRRLAVLVAALALLAPPPAGADTASGSQCPTHASPINGSWTETSPFGPRADPPGFHPGIDMAAPTGTEIDAVFDGTARYAGPAQGYGNWIVIDSQGPQGTFSTLYGHMYDNGVFIKPGEQVTAGQRIAAVGSNGFSTGPHLHYGLYPGGRLDDAAAVDPAPLLNGAQTNSGSSVNQLVAQISNCPTQQTSPGRATGKAITPAPFVPWLLKAGAMCQGIDAPLLAAQIETESAFRVDAVSPAGAKGPAQFMDSTWPSWSQEDDADSPPPAQESIGDALMAQGRFMCGLYKQATAAVGNHSVSGDPVGLAVAGYNAGFGAVQSYGGIPPFPDTMKYVPDILGRRAKYAADPQLSGSAPAAAAPGGLPGQPTVPAQMAGLDQAPNDAKGFLGRPWVWGGGDIHGPTNAGFDSSGLVRFVVFRATNGKLTLPHSVQQMWGLGTEIPLDQVKSGDLVFSGWSQAGPAHVAIAIDTKQVIASSQGQGVAISEMPGDAKARRLS